MENDASGFHTKMPLLLGEGLRDIKLSHKIHSSQKTVTFHGPSRLMDYQ
jgi:hypothetical protein